MKLAVYVPSADDPQVERLVDAGSGIVGRAYGHDVEAWVKIDFEGNRYGAANIRTYADRVHHAAGRHVVEYPTVARAVVRPSALLRVGWFDTETRQLTIDDSEKLAGWIGEYDDSELLVSS